MTRRLLFRSKSCRLSSANTSPANFSFYRYDDVDEYDEEESSPATTPFIITSPQQRSHQHDTINNSRNQLQIVDIVVAVLRKSLVTCTTIVEEEEEGMRDGDEVVEIGWPTDVQHVSHVTFDRFNGFLGLPIELQPQLPSKVPSASASVFGVSANSIQCSYDERGNSVPTILLIMQQHLRSEGGLQAEGIFRINAENSQEEYVRSQLNTGVVPHGIDVHCVAGLIKAWFRELPTGVLDSLIPERVMHCNSEDDCTQLVKLLPPTEEALLNWAINLMADVVHNESHNKMNARNIAMVFAPNMTKMADPLTALMHAVQVMNLLKTLIAKTLRQREKTPSCNNTTFSHQQAFDCRPNERAKIKNVFSIPTMNGLENSISLNKTPVKKMSEANPENGVKTEYNDRGEGIFDRLNLKKGMRKLYRHPVFQLSRPVKKSGGVEIV